MGRITLICRLVVRDLRRRPAEAVLLLLAITAASATLTLSLALHGVTSNPYLSTKTATAGPDVIAHDTMLTSSLTKLEHEPGVTGYSGPYPVAWPVLRAHGITQPVEAEGRDTAPASVDQPKVTEGSWVRSGAVVIERTFANALGVRVGDRVTLNGKSFQVAGIAVTAAIPAYPNVCSAVCDFNETQYQATLTDAGLLWLTESDARSLGTSAEPLSYRLNLTLKDPADARSFADTYAPASGQPSLIARQDISQQDGLVVADEQQVLSTGGWLLGLLAIASVAVLAGGRMAQQARRVGLLKAVGATPELVAAVMLAENLIVALVAAIAGLAAGRLAAPLLTNPGAGLVGSAGAPSLTASAIELVVIVALSVALVATFVPAIRAASSSTVTALANPARAPRRGAVLIALSARLPISLLFGLRLISRRRRRALLSTASIAVTIMAITAVLVYRSSSQSASGTTLHNPVTDRLGQVMLILTIVMVVLAAVNAILTTWATVLDARRPSALARALGASPGQISTGLSAAQIVPVLPGAVIGIPAGIGLFEIVNGEGVTVIPPTWWLAATVAGALAGMAVLTAVTARATGRGSAAAILGGTA
jgi:putative ABC transport system permease protein